jgi:hypothetical protein
MAHKKKYRVADPGPGYRPRPGSDAGGIRWRLGEPKPENAPAPQPPIRRAKKHNPVKGERKNYNV